MMKPAASVPSVRDGSWLVLKRCTGCGFVLAAMLAPVASVSAAVTGGDTGPSVAGTIDTTKSGSRAEAATHDPLPVQTTSLSEVLVYGVNNGYKLDDSRTASNTYTALIDTPFSIDAISARLWHDQGAQSLEDVMRNAPGVTVHQGEGNRDEFMMRGIKTKKDFFVNGMRDDTEYFRDLYNLDEVDVLKGPAALLFGRGNAGGVINLVTKKAERRRIRKVGLDVGRWDRRRGTVDLGGAMGPNAAWRLNAMGETSGGYRDYAKLHRYGVNPEFRFWLGPRTRLAVGGEHFYERRHVDRGIPSRDGRPADVGRSRFFGSPDQNTYHARVNSIHANLEHDFSDRLQLRDVLRVSQNKRYYRNIYPGDPVQDDATVKLKGYEHYNKRRTLDNRLELLGNFETGAVHHQLLTGVQFTHQAGDDWKNESGKHVVPLSNPHWDAPLDSDGRYTQFSRDNHAVADEAGVYVQDQLDLGRFVKAVVGARWDRFSVRAHYYDRNHAPFAYTRAVDTRWSPRAGLIFKPTENDSVYVSVTKSFVPQGSNVALSTKSPQGQGAGPQRVVNYEIGNKLDMLNQRLSFTAALFQLEQKGLWSQDHDGDAVQTGEARSRGLELVLTGSLTRNWSISANYTRIDATYRRDMGHKFGKFDIRKGNWKGLVPRNQGSLWSTYAVNEHWGFGGGAEARSRSYTTYSNDVMLPGHVRVDAMAYYQSGHQAGDYRVQLNVDNLLDTHYYPTANDDNQITPGAPRDARLSFHFYL